jgi:hypothetical protein
VERGNASLPVGGWVVECWEKSKSVSLHNHAAEWQTPAVQFMRGIDHGDLN